jgi:hypothetical protein
MAKNNKIRILKLISLVLALLLTVVFANAISMNNLLNYTVEENQTLSFSINTGDYNGTVSFSRTPAEGTLTKVNDSLANFAWTPNVGETGLYTLTFAATDSNSTITKQSTITVMQINNPPSILSATTSEPNTAQITIDVETDRACVCKYSTSSKTYNQMEYTFAQTNIEKTLHEGKTPALSQGSSKIYILCNDEFGNYMTSPKQIQLNINLRPSASISIDPDAPLKEGTVKIELSTTEPLLSAPELKYSFDDDSTSRTVALIGSGTNWEGYLIIKDTDSERVGSFTFRGYDLTNLEGTEITSGKLFLVDTQNPKAIQSISIENMDKKIKLTWEKPESESVKEYKIYKKSESGGVETVDYLDSTDDEVFYDTDVEYNIGYYYRVSIVDKAGNEGPLSKEVFTTHIPVIDDSKISPIYSDPVVNPASTKLDSKLEYILNSKIQEVEKIKKDLEKAEETISRTLGTDNIDSIDALNALNKLTDNKNQITSLATDLDALRNQNLAESSFNTAVSDKMDQIDKIWKETPIEVKVIDSSSYQEFTNDEKTNTIVSAYLNEFYPELSDRELKSKIEDTKKLQDKIIVNVKLIKGEIKYPQEVKPFSIVKKSYSSDEDLGKIVLFESVPENVQEISKIEFSDQPFLKENYAYWNFDNVNGKEITYVLHADINMADLKNVKSIALNEQDLIKEDTNQITGDVAGLQIGNLSALGDVKKSDGMFLILIIVGIVVICGLFAYYVFWSEAEPNSKAPNSNPDEKEDKKGRFDAAKALFKRRESILPDDSHRKIIIDKPEDAGYAHVDNVEFRRIENLQPPMPPSVASANISVSNKENKESNAKSQTQISSGNSENSNVNDSINWDANVTSSVQRTRPDNNTQFEELETLQRRLVELKNKTNVDDLEEFDSLRSKTFEIKRLCDELEEQSVIDFTNKTKAHLEKSLLYIARHVPPGRESMARQILERENSGEKEFYNVKKEKEVKAVKKEFTTEELRMEEEARLEAFKHLSKDPDEWKKHEVLIKNAPAGREFVFWDGDRAATIGRLKERIAGMDDYHFNYYVTDSKNDFATWIGEIFHDYDLAYRVRSTKSKNETLSLMDGF